MNAVKISEYQQWLKAYDEARGWDRVSPSQTFVHLVEEMGEVARLVLYKEGYKDPNEKSDLQAQLAEELADATTFLFKLSYLFDVDLETALAGKQEKSQRRTSVDRGQMEMQRYLESQEENLKWMRGEE